VGVVGGSVMEGVMVGVGGVVGVGDGGVVGGGDGGGVDVGGVDGGGVVGGVLMIEVRLTHLMETAPLLP
jgi:hypothetical protein